jgi:hypothetical protein
MLIRPTNVAAVSCHELAPSLNHSIELMLPFVLCGPQPEAGDYISGGQRAHLDLA